MRPWCTTLAVALLTAGCQWGGSADAVDPDELAERARRFEASLAAAPDSAGAARRDSAPLGDKPIARWVLPPQLDEISGLALGPNGRLFAVVDETATVFEIDYRRGVILKEFALGEPPVQVDIEGLAIVGETFFLVSSGGKLYESAEGADSGSVQYTEYETGLGDLCEVEGLAYRAPDRSLLLACKNPRKKRLKDKVAVYRWPLPEGPLDSMPVLLLDAGPLQAAGDLKDLSPSGMDVDAATGSLIFVAGPERQLFQLTPEGRMEFIRALPGRIHPQPEGVVFGPDGTLIVSDEAARGEAAITVYRWR